MIAEERLARIVGMVESMGTASVNDLAEALHASESTIRRDLDRLDQEGRLIKVRGGATLNRSSIPGVLRDSTITERSALHVKEKQLLQPMQQLSSVPMILSTSTQALRLISSLMRLPRRKLILQQTLFRMPQN